jgi:hypothetical protein
MSISRTEDLAGTSFQGYIRGTLQELVHTLGEPHFNDGDKVTAEWDFLSDTGVVFTIYDYKEEETPTGDYDWHIGGVDHRAVEVVRDLFPGFNVWES